MLQRSLSALIVVFLCVLLASLVSLIVFADTVGNESGYPSEDGLPIEPVSAISTPLGVAQPSDTRLPFGIREIQVCRDVTWIEAQPILSTCTTEYTVHDCLNESDGSEICTDRLQSDDYPCVTGAEPVERQRRDCVTNGYLADEHTIINTVGYQCSLLDDGKIFITCDSVSDGNGDGVCTPGESCVEYAVVGEYVVRRERNSGISFVDQDASFFMPRMLTEVLR